MANFIYVVLKIIISVSVTLSLLPYSPPPMALQPNAGYGLLIFTRFLDHTQRRTTVGRTPLDEWSARRRDLCLTTHNTHNRQTSILPAGFETTFSAGERSQTDALDRAATGTGAYLFIVPLLTTETISSSSFLFWAHVKLKRYKFFPCVRWGVHVTTVSQVSVLL